MKKIEMGILFIISILLFVWVMAIGLERQDRSDCLKWQDEADEIGDLYFITEDQKMQCDYFNIDINAHVKTVNE